MIERVPLDNISRDEWLRMRRNFVSASEAATVCGEASYGSLAELYCEKRGLRPPQADSGVLKRGRWGELATLKGEYMQRCQGPRGRIKSVMAAAKEAGVNTVAFRATVAKHRAARKLQARLENLEADDRYAFDMIQEALGEFGDTPLGAAALDRARPRERVLNIA